MPVDFSEIKVGSKWERKDLAEVWNYASFHAFGRGVFTPRDDNQIVLFVKEEKRDEDVQYEDCLSGNTLHWHGENGHGTDVRIAHAKRNGDVIHVFYKRTHRDAFTYLGRAHPTSVNLLSHEPSRFVFELLDWPAK